MTRKLIKCYFWGCGGKDEHLKQYKKYALKAWIAPKGRGRASSLTVLLNWDIHLLFLDMAVSGSWVFQLQDFPRILHHFFHFSGLLPWSQLYLAFLILSLFIYICIHAHTHIYIYPCLYPVGSFSLENHNTHPIPDLLSEKHWDWSVAIMF